MAQFLFRGLCFFDDDDDVVPKRLSARLPKLGVDGLLGSGYSGVTLMEEVLKLGDTQMLNKGSRNT